MKENIQLKTFQRDILTLRSHQWKYYVDTYPGCSFRCHYCLYGNTASFYEKIEPLSETLPQIKEELNNLGDKRPIIYVGATTDAYQSKERTKMVTRELLNFLADKDFPVMILTKSPLILRDTDILQQINKNGKLLVQFTVLTTNEDKSRILEKGTPAPSLRLDAASKLKSLGIPVHFHVSPFIPDLYSKGELEETVNKIKSSGGTCIYTNTLGMRKANKEPLLDALGEMGNGIKERVLESYPMAEVGEDGVYSPYSQYIVDGMLNFRNICQNSNIGFVCETIPQFTTFDEGEFKSGIFRFGPPAVYQMMTFWRDKQEPVSWEMFYSQYLHAFSNIDDEYINLVKSLWDKGELFENTVISPNKFDGQICYQKGNELLIDNDKVLHWGQI